MRPRVLGCAYSASASSRVTSNSASSLASDRESVPFFRYGPYRPFCAVISSPSAGSSPTTRGSDSSRSAVGRSMVSSVIDLNSDAVRGLTALAAFFAGAARSARPARAAPR